MKVMLLLFALMNLVSCSSGTKQSDLFLKREAPAITEKAKIIDVPFIKQSINYCGPASLAMIMNYKGHGVKTEDVAKQIYTPKQKGSLPTDIIGSARRNGMIAVPVHGISSLIKELAAGNPVLIFENLGLEWYPLYHYAVAVGYDVTTSSIILHSGEKKFERTDLKVFERSWKLTNYWGLVILNPRELSANGSELEHATAAASLEESGKLDEAADAYKTVLKRWPDSLPALIGLGNIRYTENDLPESLKYLRRALRKHPGSAAVKNNLKVALRALK